MPKIIWVVAETWKGRITDTTFEALALGRELASPPGAMLEAILIGHGVAPLAAQLGLADKVRLVDHPALAEPEPTLWAEALTQLPRDPALEAVLLPLTNITLGAGAMLSARWSAPAINFCKDLAVSEGRVLATCLLYGGKIEAVVSPAASPAIFGIWPGARPAAAGHSDRTAPIEECAFTPPAYAPPALQRYLEAEAGDVDITRQDALVAVGRGIQSRDNIEVAEELANVLGGAVCGSRPVIDQGWLPLSRQVGKSGHSVKPKIYIALGISGAPEHLEGMKDSEVIVAVNTDARAPIFGAAHYGYVGDALDFAPALAKALETWKKAHV
jgi:electron transfer flavoprotein alpha subunit